MLIGCGTLAVGVPVEAGRPLKKSSSTTPPRETLRWNGIDLQGRLHQFGAGSGNRAVALVFLSSGCPISNGYIPRLNALARKFKSKKVRLYGVLSDPYVTRAEAIKHSKTYHIEFPVLFDASGELCRAFQPSHVPQAIVLDQRGKTVYSGLIDDEYAAIGQKKARFDRHFLADAIDDVRRGRKPAVTKTVPIGCLVEEPPAVKDRPSTLTYCRDIAPIIQAHCTTCHRAGEAAPFELKTFEDVRKRSRQIAEVTQSRLMPPWQPEPGFGHFRDERRLTTREIQLISEWVRGGKRKGNPDDLPPMPEFTKGWQLGEPDLILKMAKPFRVAANGSDILRHFVIPTGLTRDRLVAAMEFRPGNPRVAHHCSVFFDNSGAARRLDAASPGYGYDRFGGPGFRATGSLGNWLPGSMPCRLPDGVGRRMPKGADLVLQMHYQRTGKVEYDQSTVGIFFAPRTCRQMVSEFQVLNADLSIPAGAKRHFHRATYVLPVDITLFDAAPHMHLLGREMKVTAKLPSGRVKPLIWIKRWDFNWQGQYVYLKPIRLPRGTRIVVDAWLDNSKSNRLNPNSPPKTVHWGDATNDEMPLCQFRYTTRSLRDYLKMESDYSRFLWRQFRGAAAVTR